MFKRKTGGSPRKTREKEPDANETFLIAQTARLHADMIEPILRENGVPFERRGTLGTAATLNAGTRFETYRFYVPAVRAENVPPWLPAQYGRLTAGK